MANPDTKTQEMKSSSKSSSSEKPNEKTATSTTTDRPIEPKGDWKLYAINQIGSEEAKKDPLNFNLLLYGPPGVGKTRFGATATFHPQMREVLYLNIEGGLLTVREMGLKHPPIAIDIHSAAELEAVFWELHRKKGDFARVRTVIIDNASELVPMELEMIARRKMKRPNDRHESIDDFHLDDRGEVSARLSRILRWYRDLDMNTIITAHPRYEYRRDKDNRPTSVLKECVPGFPDALRRALIGYQDFVWLMGRSNGGHQILTAPRGPYYAKTRGQVFPRNLGQMFKVPVDAPAVADIYKMLQTGSTLPEQYQIENKQENE